MKFTFGDIVVIEENLIGVIVKCWNKNKFGHEYDVYVRNFNCIKNYQESEIERYMVRHKYLNDEELEYQNNIVNNS